MSQPNHNSLFHTMPFLDLIVKEHKNARVVEWTIDGQTIYGIESRNLFFRQLIILPFGLYLPVITQESLRKFFEIINKEKEKYHHIVVNIPPDNAHFIPGIHPGKEFCIRSHECNILPLDKPIDELISGFSETRKKHLKRIRKLGALKIFQTRNKEYFEKYYDVYLRMLVRWGESHPGYSRDLITSLYQVNNIKLWVAEYEGEMVSGMICFYGENCVFDWLAATLINDDVKKLYPAIAVQFAVIEDAAANGFAYVNMGASENLAGVKEFKESWNTLEKNYFSIQYQHRFFRLFKRIQMTMFKAKGFLRHTKNK